MAWLRKNDVPEDDSQSISPEKRVFHESALIDDHLHLFGGFDGLKHFPRNEIFVMNVRRAEKKWIRRLTRGRTIPPPCFGARCVVIDKMIDLLIRGIHKRGSSTRNRLSMDRSSDARRRKETARTRILLFVCD